MIKTPSENQVARNVPPAIKRVQSVIPGSHRPVTAQTTGKGFFIRGVSYVIDIAAILFGYAVVWLPIAVVVTAAATIAGRPQVSSSESSVSWIVGTLAYASYFILFEWMYGATVGKLILKMRVIQTDGSPCDLRAAFLRMVWRFVDGLFVVIPAILVMKPPLYQRIGDRTAGTMVVGSRDRVIKHRRPAQRFFLATAMWLVSAGMLAFVETLLSFR